MMVSLSFTGGTLNKPVYKSKLLKCDFNSSCNWKMQDEACIEHPQPVTGGTTTGPLLKTNSMMDFIGTSKATVSEGTLAKQKRTNYSLSECI